MICMNKVGTNIPLRKIREDFHLKSTFFNICIAEDSVLFSGRGFGHGVGPVSYTHLRAHETVLDLVCRLLLEKKNKYAILNSHFIQYTKPYSIDCNISHN